MTPRLYRAALAAASVLLATTLAACGGPAPTPTPTPDASTAPTASAGPDASPTPTPEPVPVSNSIDGITVQGALGSVPQVSIPTPFAIDETRTRTISEGKGEGALAEGIVEVNYVGINARTGQTFDSSWEKGEPALMSLQQVVPGFTKGLTGAKPGERRLVVMPGVDGYDSNGGRTEAGIEVGDTLVFVVDMVSVQTAAPSGVAQQPSLPVTVGEADGKPTVTIPTGEQPPSELVIAPLIVGEQRKVGENDIVITHFRSWSWNSGQQIEDNFGDLRTGPIADALDGFKRAVIGQPIGSRVLVIVPPAYGYERASQKPAIAAGDTVVFVIDILYSYPQS
ncbi:MAG: FKBP-type peptidyl-prolyl cis-trans isomerase [Propioniciclava sp.]|uniref:FKBP-type peptidyl-prolyl cis-trans isomerase n=1 Tax=Propioniciclava sp. TaxID=2038686 RepID=UPI0039E6EC40